MKKAVLFLTFNRLDTTQKVFEQIKIAQPPRLYIASDGAREDINGENERVKAVRKWILDNINWNCEIKTKFNETNLGCGKSVSSAITWFFDNEEDGIILEDDCVPNQSFFPYCEELLDKYKDDKRIWHISGDNILGKFKTRDTYYFNRLMFCWGWASWKDRWKNYSLDISNLNDNIVENSSKMAFAKKQWLEILKIMKQNKIDTWDFQWVFKIIANKGLCINPSKNLISNIGTDGVHYENQNNAIDPRLNAKTYTIKKMTHPKQIKYNEKACKLIDIKLFKNKKTFLQKFINYVCKNPLFILKKDFYQKVLKTLLKKKNKPIIYENFLGIDMPKEHKIYEYMFHHKYYDKNLSRIIPTIISKYNNLTMIDVGANIGDTLAILRHDNISIPTLCVEGDDEYFSYLEKNSKQFEDVTITKTFLGETDKASNFNISKSDGTAQLIKSNKQIEIKTLDTLLSNYQNFLNSKLLKIDTDGFDNIILKGSKSFLNTTKPIIFMEYNPNDLAKQNDNGTDIFEYLNELKYTKAIMYSNYGEYMFSFDTNNNDFIEEMRDYFIKNTRIYYADILLFNNEDLDLFKACRHNELDFFKQEKKNL